MAQAIEGSNPSLSAIFGDVCRQKPDTRAAAWQDTFAPGHRPAKAWTAGGSGVFGASIRLATLNLTDGLL
jgi:hypothetical protein